MIQSSRSQQQRVLRAVRALNEVVKPPIAVRLPQRRHVSNISPGAHRVPPLTHGEQYAREGIPGLMSPGGFNMAWTQYQTYLVTKLNEMTARTPDEHSQVKTILLKHARDPSKASLFNHASMAHNNHLFFSTISPTTTNPSSRLLPAIERSFSSVAGLRSTFIATAASLFGPGFVWLVHDLDVGPSALPHPTQTPLSILVTYIAGTPYPAAHFRLQPLDMATAATNIAPDDVEGYVARYGGGLQQAVNTVGAFGKHSARVKGAPGGARLQILLAVNTWEHVWLRDYGIGGKRAFLERWWERIDWGVVEQNYGR